MIDKRPLDQVGLVAVGAVGPVVIAVAAEAPLAGVAVEGAAALPAVLRSQLSSPSSIQVRPVTPDRVRG